MTDQYRGSVKGIPKKPGTIRRYIPPTYYKTGEVEISSDEEEWPYLTENQEYKPGPIKEQKYWESVRARILNDSIGTVEYSNIYKRFKTEQTRVKRRIAEEGTTVNYKLLNDSNGFFFNEFVFLYFI